MIKLYEHPLSPFAQKVKIAMYEQGLFVREYRDHRLEWMMRSGGTQIVLDGMEKRNIRFSVELA